MHKQKGVQHMVQDAYMKAVGWCPTKSLVVISNLIGFHPPHHSEANIRRKQTSIVLHLGHQKKYDPDVLIKSVNKPTFSNSFSLLGSQCWWHHTSVWPLKCIRSMAKFIEDRRPAVAVRVLRAGLQAYLFRWHPSS